MRVTSLRGASPLLIYHVHASWVNPQLSGQPSVLFEDELVNELDDDNGDAGQDDDSDFVYTYPVRKLPHHACM